MKRITEEAGIKDFVKPFLNLRSTRSTELAEKGIAIRQTGDWSDAAAFDAPLPPQCRRTIDTRNSTFTVSSDGLTRPRRLVDSPGPSPTLQRWDGA